MNSVIAVMVVYLGLLVGFAIWSRKETHSLKGFYLAGKKLPYWVVAFSTNATGESGWLLLGLTGMGYAVGAQAYWVVIGEILGIAGSWWLISRRLKRLSDEHDSITVPDALAAKFQDRWHLIRGVAVIIILSMVTVYVTAQMVASGKALDGFLGIPYEWGVVAGSVIIIAYTFIGGHKAVSYTDVLQGVLMFLGLLFVPIVAINAAGGWDAIMATLAAEDSGLTDMFSLTSSGFPGWIAAASFVGIGLPFLGVPQLLVRYMSIREEEELKKARWVSVIVLFVFTFGAVTAGIAGRALFPGLADPEQIFPMLSSELFSPLVAGILLVIVISAIMSTADSLLLLASSAVVRDTMQKIMGSTKSDHQLAVFGKVVTILIGVAGIAVAWDDQRKIFDFVLYAWSGLGAAFGPTLLCLLYYKKTTWAGVIAGMIAGFATSIIWVEQFKAETYDLYEAIPGFIAGFVATFVVSALTRRESKGGG
ncbi:MAG: sodium/solute symporter [Woeseiaceae bacterium]|nr:sodium/solute symporter [Woeseiaceae bacterium]NIP21919.1 sodium/solute symporter [Woeseiaceae bacterium]NIS91004.1 sodium/solute symporter [Woeseiaceae bacterium]